MPNFTIRRRRKKVPERQVAPKHTEEKIDEAEEIASIESEDSLIESTISELKETKLDRTRTVPQHYENTPQRRPIAQNNRPQRQNLTRFATQTQNPASYQNCFATPRHIPNQYTRKPTMQRHVPNSRTKCGGAKLIYRSYYGAGGEHLDTRTKSILLYNHCF